MHSIFGIFVSTATMVARQLAKNNYNLQFILKLPLFPDLSVVLTVMLYEPTPVMLNDCVIFRFESQLSMAIATSVPRTLAN